MDPVLRRDDGGGVMETTLFQFFVGMFAAGVVAVLAVIVHYEGLTLISKLALPKYEVHRRWTLLYMMLFVFALHCLEIWLYAGGVALLDILDLGGLYYAMDVPAGVYGVQYVYYATIIYTSIGFGDIVPLGALRMFSGAAGLTGLLLIAWSASFTYIMMEKLWKGF